MPKAKKITANSNKTKKEKHESNLNSLFQRMGFKHIPSDGKQISFEGRTGDIDAIFMHENVILLVEYTTGGKSTEHLGTKIPLFELILENQAKFVDLCKQKYEGFSDALNAIYTSAACEVKIIYAPTANPSQEMQHYYSAIKYFHGPIVQYFNALANTIEKSSIVEFLKFLGIERHQIGKSKLTGIRESVTYLGHLLPETNTSYPSGFKLVSFYADPETLIGNGYVLRRDGWRDSNHLYQRILNHKKIRSMRKYLSQENRVFVNNIIVTLDPDVVIKPVLNGHAGVDSDLNSAKHVSIQIEKKFDSIGIIDGQHRVFCYHESSDEFEKEIAPLRVRQSLMVSGIIYPKFYTEEERRAFEAKLFMEINENQSPVSAALKQDVALVISPYSVLALSKRVVQELNKDGIFKGRLQSGHFDGPEKIKTASIVNYGLKPIIKLDGSDSFFSIWGEPDKLALKGEDASGRADLANQYISFCTSMMKKFFDAISAALIQSGNSPDVLRTPTAINGMINCMRRIVVSNGKPIHELTVADFSGIEAFDFTGYKSSHWKQLGDDLFEKYLS